MNRSLWILNHYALTPDLPGGTRHFDLARELVSRGYDVTIVASAFNHNLHQRVRLLGGEAWALEEAEGVKFLWLPSFPYRANDWRRMANMLEYSWRAYWLGRRLTGLVPRIPPPDAVLGCSVHLFAVLAAYYLSRHYRAHFLMEVRDLWPQTFLDMGVWREGQVQVRFFRRLEQFLYNRAEQIITLSPLTKEYLARFSRAWADKVLYVPNGTRMARFEQTAPTRQSGSKPVRTMYLGSMGISNGLELILQAMKSVDQQAPGLMECILVGDGPEKPRLERMAHELGLKGVRFEPPVPRDQVPTWTAQADILVLVQREVLYGSSNKLYDYMAAGKPIAFAVFADHNNPVEQARCGLAASPDDPEDLARILLQLARMAEEDRRTMGLRGRAFVSQNHDYSVLVQRLTGALEMLDEGTTLGPQD